MASKNDLVARIDAIERKCRSVDLENRHLKRSLRRIQATVCLVILGTTAVVACAAAAPQRSLELERLAIVDREGRTRATFEVPENGLATLSFLDAVGKSLLELQSAPEGNARISIRDSDGNLRCDLSLNKTGDASLRLSNVRGDRQVSSSAAKDGMLGLNFGSSLESGASVSFVCRPTGVPLLGFNGTNGKSRALLDGCSEKPSLIFAGRDNGARLTLGVSSDDKPFVSLSDGKRPRMFSSLDNDRAQLNFADANGRDRLSVGLVPGGPLVTLGGSDNKTRMYLGLSDQNDPTIGLLDAQGNVVTRIPGP